MEAKFAAKTLLTKSNITVIRFPANKRKRLAICSMVDMLDLKFEKCPSNKN